MKGLLRVTTEQEIDVVAYCGWKEGEWLELMCGSLQMMQRRRSSFLMDHPLPCPVIG